MPGYTVPTDPTNPEQAALQMIVEVPQAILDSTAFRTRLTDYADRLRAERTFAGLSWHDARHVAAAIAYDIIAHEGDAAEYLRNRARNVLAGVSGADWDDQPQAAQAPTLEPPFSPTQPTRWGS
ncbi:MAG TPA: hypothetical protein VMU34_26190 [Mycobacterium sp.]|nr:hypothetical protein [Mycobacterium sp.]